MCQKLCVCSHGSTLNDVWPISRPCSAVINLLLLVLTLLFLCSSVMWQSTGCVAVMADPTEITVSCTETPASPRPRYMQSTEDTVWVSTFPQVLYLYAQFCCTCPLPATFHFKILFYFYTTTGKCFHPLLLFNSLHFFKKKIWLQIKLLHIKPILSFYTYTIPSLLVLAPPWPATTLTVMLQ